MINLSLGGAAIQGPAHRHVLAAERDAVAYAGTRRESSWSSAVGNGPTSRTPWSFADWPVVAAARDRRRRAARGRVGAGLFSNRDPLFVDLAAPGEGVFSTIPRNLVDRSRAGCTGRRTPTAARPISSTAIGTSFAAPQVSAAAALLLGQDPTLKPDQVAWLLERSADRHHAGDRLRRCPTVATR